MDFRVYVVLPLITETLKFISEIWFLVVDFRVYVSLPLITETLKFQCNHHYFALPLSS